MRAATSDRGHDLARCRSGCLQSGRQPGTRLHAPHADAASGSTGVGVRPRVESSWSIQRRTAGQRADTQARQQRCGRVRADGGRPPRAPGAPPAWRRRTKTCHASRRPRLMGRPPGCRVDHRRRPGRKVVAGVRRARSRAPRRPAPWHPRPTPQAGRPAGPADLAEERRDAAAGAPTVKIVCSTNGGEPEEHPGGHPSSASGRQQGQRTGTAPSETSGAVRRRRTR